MTDSMVAIEVESNISEDGKKADLECDLDGARWEDTLRKGVKQKPADKPE